ncbi:MAG: hypothetical protein ACKO0Z_05755 [Betaproteobacteria bacterium]
MKLRWTLDVWGWDGGIDSLEKGNPSLEYRTDSGEYVEVAYLTKVGDWWEVCACWVMEHDSFPDGARFTNLRAAKLFASKQATIAIVGGYKP